MYSIVFNVPETTTVITEEIVKQHATEGRKNVKKVTIPKHIRRIDDRAFSNCRSLEEVIFEKESICTEIGRDAFSKCYSLKQINLPNTIFTIDRGAFQYCESVEEINLPQTLTEIGEFAFCGCESLKQIILPNSITRIGNCAFAICKSLVYVYLPQSLQCIDEEAFSACTRLSVIATPQHTDIRPSAFRNCTIINKVSLRRKMRRIVLLQQRLNNHLLHQICYDPAITIDSLTKAIKEVNDKNDNYKHGDAFDMNALHILCYNPSVTDQMISTLVAAFPSLRSIQCIEGLTPVIIYINNKYGNEAEKIFEDKPRLALDDFLRHRILRQDEIVYMLASDDEMQEELNKLDEKDEQTGLYPFMQIAMNKSYNLESLYWLMQANPNLLTNIDQFDLVQTSIAVPKSKKQRNE